MGPKDAKKERARREEAERKAREEEEARLQAEREEFERKEQEKREAAERLIRENEECRLRKVQLHELESICSQYEVELNEERAEARRQAKWARYMKCDGSPDPTILPDINMYMSLWREDRQHNDFDMVLKESGLVLKLIDELQDILDDTSDEELTAAKRAQYESTMEELASLLKEKLDLGSLSVMSKASLLADSETNNLEYMKGNDSITLCLWGNLSKNPRIKTYEFIEKGLFFELPKVLTLSDCVIRAMFTKFDHYSTHSASFYPKIKQKEPVETSISTSETHLNVHVVDGEEDEAEVEEAEEITSRETSMADIHAKDENLSDILKQLSGEDIAKNEEDELESVHSSRVAVESDYEIKTPEPVDYEEFDGDEDAVDLRGAHVVGGVFHFNLLQMPPQPKVIRNWTITQLVEPPELHHLSYVVDLPKQELSHTSTSRSDTHLEHKSDVDTARSVENILKPDIPKPDVSKEKKEVERPPILITLKLPDDVYFCEEPQIVRWDDKDKVWRTDGFLDKLYTETTRLLTFRTCHFGTLALIQDAHINMPFQSWELRPRATNHAQLTIIAAVVEVEIQIKDGLVCLSQPDKRPELQHLINQWMSVHDLIKKMRVAGVNVFPAEDSFKYVKIPDKNTAAEYRLYSQMALVGSVMAFSWSRWNVDVNDSERILIQAAEHTTDEPLLEDEWWLCMVTKKSCARLAMSEFDEAFNDERTNSEFCADLYHLTKLMVNEKSVECVANTQKNFIDTVNQLLMATRVITFA